MGTPHALIIFLLVLVVGLVLFNLAMYLTERLMKKKVSAWSLLKDFRQKMWMTTGLGILFFGLYLLFVGVGYYANDSATRLHFFFLVYEHPVVFIYLGLLFFACISIGIYLCRIVIKYLYNTRRKD